VNPKNQPKAESFVTPGGYRLTAVSSVITEGVDVTVFLSNCYHCSNVFGPVSAIGERVGPVIERSLI
jgi:hypothetical protein